MSAVEKEVIPPKAKDVEAVKMSDGRVVEFAGKRKLLKEVVFGTDGEVGGRFDFRNGETRTYWSPSELVTQFAGHGILQKYGDETAGEEDVDDMVLATDALDERIQKGEWTTKREGGGMAGTSVLLKALIEFSGNSIEKVKEFLKNKTQAEKMALRNSAKLKPIVERLEQEKLSKAAKVDTDALLGELA